MNFKRIALLSLAINVAGLLFFAGRKIQFHSQPKENPQIKYWDRWNVNQVSVFKWLEIDTADYVFVGNSLTEGFPLQEIFHSTHFKNRGVMGNRSSHIRERIGSIAGCHPKKIFLDVGINDILNDLPADSPRINFRAAVDTIRARSPQTEIIAQTVLPLGPSQKAKEPLVLAFNAWLKEFCRQENIACIDLFPAFLKDGVLDQSLTLDDIHINGKGYAIWKKRLQPYLP